MDTNYEINSATLALLPVNNKLTQVIEEDNQIFIENSIQKIIDESCKVFGSSYGGRYEGTKKMIGINYKSPIIISEYNEIIFFPTSSPNLETCCWISLNNLKKYEKRDRTTTIHFNNNTKIDINISSNIIENQIYKATMLESKLRKVKNN